KPPLLVTPARAARGHQGPEPEERRERAVDPPLDEAGDAVDAVRQRKDEGELPPQGLHLLPEGLTGSRGCARHRSVGGRLQDAVADAEGAHPDEPAALETPGQAEHVRSRRRSTPCRRLPAAPDLDSRSGRSPRGSVRGWRN